MARVNRTAQRRKRLFTRSLTPFQRQIRALVKDSIALRCAIHTHPDGTLTLRRELPATPDNAAVITRTGWVKLVRLALADATIPARIVASKERRPSSRRPAAGGFPRPETSRHAGNVRFEDWMSKGAHQVAAAPPLALGWVQVTLAPRRSDGP